MPHFIDNMANNTRRLALAIGLRHTYRPYTAIRTSKRLDVRHFLENFDFP